MRDIAPVLLWAVGGDRGLSEGMCPFVAQTTQENQISFKLRFFSSCNAAFQNITIPYDLFVTIPLLDLTVPNTISYTATLKKFQPHIVMESTMDKIPQISNRIRQFKTDAKVFALENRGLDPGGFLFCLNHIFTNKLRYDYVIKLHSKMRNEDWRRELFNAILASQDVFKKCVKVKEFESFLHTHVSKKQKFEDHPGVGMIGPGKWIINLAGPVNSKWINEYKKRLNITTSKSQFVGGTMFMARFSVFEPFAQFPLSDWFAEMEFGYRLDGLAAHAMERILGYMVWNCGKIICPS